MTAIQQRPAPLPLDVEGLTKHLQQKKTVIKDNVMAILLTLYRDDPSFQALLEATEDDDAIHGSFQMDRCFAAIMIKEKATQDKNSFVMKLSEAAIAVYIERCMASMGHSRRQRRKGEMVPAEADNVETDIAAEAAE